MSTKLVFVQSDHLKVYGPEYSDKNPLERGQVFSLSNQLNDEKMLGWGYVKELEPEQETYACKCGRTFLGTNTDPAFRAHGLKWHGQCNPKINLDEKVAVKSGAKPVLRGGGNPDADGPGWDVGVGEDASIPVAEDPYQGERLSGGREKPKRLSLG